MNRAEKLRSWTRRIQAVADEMELEGFEDWARHLDSISVDCEFEEQAFIGGEEVKFSNAFFIGKLNSEKD